MVRARLIALVVVIVAIVAAAFHARPPRALTIETGPEGGSYYRAATKYRDLLAREGIELRIKPIGNTLDILKDISDRQVDVDVGFFAQDVSTFVDPNVMTLGSVELQPLFVFTRAELGRRSVMDDLRGRRIVLPPKDSATSDAALKMLQLYDITAEGANFSFIPLADAAKALHAGRYDAGMFMLGPDNPLIRELAADSGLRLMPMSEAMAISHHLPFLRPVHLPRGIYNIADSIPPNDTTLLASTVGIAVRRDLHPYLIYMLLEAMTKVHRGPTFISNAGEFPTPVGSQLPVHPAAADYYQSGMPWLYRILPAWPASFLDAYTVALLVILLLSAISVTSRFFADLGLAIAALFTGRFGVRRRDAEVRPVAAPPSVSAPPINVPGSGAAS